MQPAADAMAQALTDVAMRDPAVPVIANVVAGPVTTAQEVRRRLVEQVTGTVRWRECVGYMASHGVTLFAELGAGKVLTGLARRMAADARAMSAGTPAEVAEVAAALRS